jgi:hypothetical protein
MSMTPYEELIIEAERLSQTPGQVTAPVRLLSAATERDKPIEALCDRMHASTMFDALAQDFEYFRRMQVNRDSLGFTDVEECASLLRWLKQKLQGWHPDADAQRATLASLIVVAQAHDPQGLLWRLLPDEIGGNRELIETLARLIGSFAIRFETPGVRAPIWEQEAVDALIEAEQRRDWRGIASNWSAFDLLLLPNSLQTQVTRALARYDAPRLALACDGVYQTMTAMLIAEVLSVPSRLRLGTASQSPFIQFAAVYRTVAGRGRGNVELDAADSDLLEAVLNRMMEVPALWRGTLDLFNAQPAWYQALQAPLGRCLASAPDDALAGYVDTLRLTVLPARPDASRDAIAKCLTAFKTIATPQRRRQLWSLAHAHWTAWDFDHHNPNSTFNEISWSRLDYAVIAYVAECLTPQQREAAINRVIHDLTILDTVWHKTESQIITGWHRLLSRLQPYAAGRDASDGDWWENQQIRLPAVLLKDRYLALKYRTNPHSPINKVKVAPADAAY